MKFKAPVFPGLFQFDIVSRRAVASVSSIVRPTADLNTFLDPSRPPRGESVDFEPSLHTQDHDRGSTIYVLEPF